MKKIGTTLLLVLMVLLLSSCSNQSKETEGASFLDDKAIVASRSTFKGDSLVTCFYESLKDTVDFPLSRVMKDIKITRLEDTDSALVSRYHTFASENYIGVFTEENEYKLFDKNGKFLCLVGRRGQGPGEYTSIYDSHMDEFHDRVYIMPWNQKKILVYNLKGELQPDIPLQEIASKARFRVDTRNQTVEIAILPFSNKNNLIVWIQNFQGEITDSVLSKPYQGEYVDFSSEIISYRNTPEFDYYQLIYWPITQDSLYHYIKGQEKLKPVFTVDFGKKEPIHHYYIELPHYYITIKAEEESKDQWGLFFRPVPKQFIVDKHTLRGAWVNLVIDELGNLPVPPQSVFQDGYFIANYYPGELKEGLRFVLSNPNNDLSKEKAEELKELYDSIDKEDGNNIIITGKLKQSYLINY